MVGELLNAFKEGYTGYAGYLWREITHPHWANYFYWLTGISLFFFSLELLKPWRIGQAKFRKDFWLDVFYMYFNYFLFSLIIFNGLSKAGIVLFDNFIGLFGTKNIVAFHLENLPAWGQVLILFFVADFLQWWTHRLLHRVKPLWEFHKVHHSVEQMGFAAHLRYHWMETFVYKLTQFIPLSMIGFDIQDLFALYMFNTVVGHFNHSNITVNGKISAGVLGGLLGLALISGAFELNVFNGMPLISQAGIFFIFIFSFSLLLGPLMKYIFNSPEMHIWHHAHDLPKGREYGINFGLTLSIWDWLFRTAWWPESGRDIRLGFPGVEKFPSRFLKQFVYGFSKKKDQ